MESAGQADLIYNVHSVSCVDQTNAKSRPLRRVPGNSPSLAQMPVGNVLFPTRPRCLLFAKFGELLA
ncbi:MAG TPA: hypothetical protein VFC84_13480, partial [Desulfosporosinus sp.]|nr:hypothetical protein [Desulfosporosinus sp.]